MWPWVILSQLWTSRSLIFHLVCSFVCFFVLSFCLFCTVSPERLMAFVTFRGLTLYREKLLLELSRKIANIITRQVNALPMIFDKILTVFSNLFERMERIGIKSPIKNNFWLFKDFKSFEGFLEAHFASYALFLWTLKICDVRTFVTSVLYTCSRYEAFSDKMREHPANPNLSFLSFKATKGFRK